jgi:cell division protein FtsB
MPDIVFVCPLCHKSLSVDEKGAGLVVDCPECKGKIRIPKTPEGNPVSPKKPSPLLTSLLVAVGALAVWALIASLVASSRGATVARLRYELASVTANIDTLKKEAETLRKQADADLAKAKQDADRIVGEAEAKKKEAEGFVLREQQELQRIYPRLTKYTPGRNEVNQRYLEAFDVSDNRIKTFMRNRSSESARPKFTILFLTKYGFVTESFNKSWLLDSMRPGQSRIDDDSGIYWRFGEPVYYTLEFQD